MKKGSKLDRDIIGKKFGLLKIVSFSHVFKRRSYWHCECECGTKLIMRKKDLQEKKNPSCGCINRTGSKFYITTQKEKEDFRWDRIKNLSHWEGECLIWDGFMHQKSPKMTTPDGETGVRRWIYQYYNPEFNKKLFVTCKCKNYKCINIKHIGVSTNGKCN